MFVIDLKFKSLKIIISNESLNISAYLLDSNGYVMNFGSKGMSGRLLLNFTRQTRSDLQRHNITGVHTRTHNRIIITIKQKQKLQRTVTFKIRITNTCVHTCTIFLLDLSFHLIKLIVLKREREREREMKLVKVFFVVVVESKNRPNQRETERESRMGAGGCMI